MATAQRLIVRRLVWFTVLPLRLRKFAAPPSRKIGAPERKSPPPRTGRPTDLCQHRDGCQRLDKRNSAFPFTSGCILCRVGNGGACSWPFQEENWNTTATGDFYGGQEKFSLTCKTFEA
jgi:hypothetical protein